MNNCDAVGDQKVSSVVLQELEMLGASIDGAQNLISDLQDKLVIVRNEQHAKPEALSYEQAAPQERKTDLMAAIKRRIGEVKSLNNRINQLIDEVQL